MVRKATVIILAIILSVNFHNIQSNDSSTSKSDTNSKDINRQIKEAPPSEPLGMHIIAEFWNIQNNIDNKEDLKKILTEAAKESNSIPLSISIEIFEPQGITGVIILAESHISIHSWPQHNYVAVDAFTCGSNTYPQKAIESLRKAFNPKEIEILEIQRGIENNANKSEKELLWSISE